MTDENLVFDSTGDNFSNRVPLTPLVARRLVLKLFQGKDQWTRQDLAKSVEQQHLRGGGLPGGQPAIMVVKKVLSVLREEGVVLCVSKGLWRYIADSHSTPIQPDSIDLASEDPVSDDQEDQGGLQIEEVIGTGDQFVYLYYNPNDFLLAQHEKRSTWECKIGSTTGAVDARILGQGARTALSHPPVIGLIIRTQDAIALESILHRSLQLADSAVMDSPGTEWFMTSPSRVKAWYIAYMDALLALEKDSEIPSTVQTQHSLGSAANDAADSQ